MWSRDAFITLLCVAKREGLCGIPGLQAAPEVWRLIFGWLRLFELGDRHSFMLRNEALLHTLPPSELCVNSSLFATCKTESWPAPSVCNTPLFKRSCSNVVAARN
jgi:hypothetical protein